VAAAEEVWHPRDFCLYCAEGLGIGARIMPIFSQLMFRAVHWAARRGLREEGIFLRCEKAGSPAHRHSRRNLCLLVFAEARVRICRADYTPRGIKANSI